MRETMYRNKSNKFGKIGVCMNKSEWLDLLRIYASTGSPKDNEYLASLPEIEFTFKCHVSFGDIEEVN